MVRTVCARAVALLFVLGAFVTSGHAQFPTPEPPPPPKSPAIDFAKTLAADGLPTGLGAEERVLLARVTDPKDRLQTYLQLLGVYRDRARKQTAQGEFLQATWSLIVYAGLATSAARTLTGLPPKKREGLLKKFELSLRNDVPFLEAMRRDFNYYYGDNVDQMVLLTKQARVDALNALFGGEDILRRPGEKVEPAKPDEAKPDERRNQEP